MNLRDELLAIYTAHKRLTPELVVHEARRVDHPLHGRFEWNDTIAAEKYRREQAADLIRSVKITYSEQPTEKSVRGFVNLRPNEASSGVYVPTEEAVIDDFTYRLLLAECQREWVAFKAKYDHLAEFADIIRGTSGAA